LSANTVSFGVPPFGLNTLLRFSRTDVLPYPSIFSENPQTVKRKTMPNVQKEHYLTGKPTHEQPDKETAGTVYVIRQQPTGKPVIVDVSRP
jgi:hypothetical protein